MICITIHQNTQTNTHTHIYIYIYIYIIIVYIIYRIYNIDYNLSIYILFMIPGSLPTEIGNLINIHYFWINNNQFSGKIFFNIYNII